jgi:hypothetical protein
MTNNQEAAKGGAFQVSNATTSKKVCIQPPRKSLKPKAWAAICRRKGDDVR